MLANTPLVSIIIPTYNRAHLIGETLESIIAQTYTNWECIVVDDGSTDTTDQLMAKYLAKDSRFQLHHRPKHRLKGGNAARNYGFEVSKGDYIQWFDSDDLMVSENLEIKIFTIFKEEVDFVISQTKYFNRDDFEDYKYNYSEKEVNFLSYATKHISWFTPDIFVKRNIVENVQFNEILKSGQEYNFSCKLLLETNSLKKIDQVLTLRRHHAESIGRKRQIDKEHYWVTTFKLHWTNYDEFGKKSNVPDTFKKFTLLKCAKAYLSSKTFNLPSQFHKCLIHFFKIQSLFFYLAIVSKKIFNRYDYFYLKLKS